MASRITKLAGGSSHFLFISDVIYTITLARGKRDSQRCRTEKCCSIEKPEPALIRFSDQRSRKFPKMTRRIISSLSRIRRVTRVTRLSISNLSIDRKAFARARSTRCYCCHKLRLVGPFSAERIKGSRPARARARTTCFVTINRR